MPNPVPIPPCPPPPPPPRPRICFPRFRVDNIDVRNITARKMQVNDVTQVSDQFGSASALYGQALARNESAQAAPSSQTDVAYNRIKIDSNARRSNINVRNILADNLQSNTALQSNTQKAISQTLGMDPAENLSSQFASNLQNGTAYNWINIVT